MNVSLNTIPYCRTSVYQGSNVSFGQLAQRSIAISPPAKEQCVTYLPAAQFLKPPLNKTYGRDDLTGLRGKGYLLNRLASRMNEAKKNNAVFSMIMFDMDNFKSVNELLGYGIGDIFIQTVAKHIRDVAQENNVGSYRFGGEEFVIMFNDEKLSKIKEAATKICHDILKDPVLLSHKAHYLSVADKKLEKLTVEKDKLDNFINLHTKYEGLKEFKLEYLKDTKDKDSSYSEYMDESLNKKHLELKDAYKQMLHQAAINETDIATRKMLVQNEDALNSGDKNQFDAVLSDENLIEYLKATYGHAFEIAQLNKWKRCTEGANGFSITAGIKEFRGKELAKMPEEVINEVGEVLKKGKNTQKGCVYAEGALS